VTERVLVTGAAGFVGSHTCRALLEAGFEVIGLDNFDPFYPRALKERALAPVVAHPGMRMIEGDVRDPAVLERAFEGITAVIHLAARPGVRDSVGHERLYRAINIGGTLAVLAACARSGVSRLVFASSSCVYGDLRPPFREAAVLPLPRSPYGATKQEGERWCRQAAKQGRLAVAVLRLFSVYGPGQRPDQAMHRFARAMVRGEAVPIYGTGSEERDYTYVGDVARGVTAALAWTEGREGCCEVFNLGTGETTRLDRLVALLADRLGVEPTVSPAPRHQADAVRTQADRSRAAEVLGWVPRTGLEQGVSEFVEWFEEVYGSQPVATA
jgi:UDP-glucuronate 4-epimerase